MIIITCARRARFLPLYIMRHQCQSYSKSNDVTHDRYIEHCYLFILQNSSEREIMLILYCRFLLKIFQV